MKAVFKFLLVLFPLISNLSVAFAAENPPQELMDSDVASAFGMNNTTTYGYSVRQFTDAYKTGADIRWEKEGSGWIFHVDRTDKMANTKTQIAILFQQLSGKRTNVSKWNIDGDYLSSDEISGMLLRTQTDFIQAGVIKVNEEPATANKKNAQAPPTKTTAVQPAPTGPDPHAAEIEAAINRLVGSYFQITAVSRTTLFSIDKVSPDTIHIAGKNLKTCDTTVKIGFKTDSEFVVKPTEQGAKLDWRIALKKDSVRILSPDESSCSGSCCQFKSAYMKFGK